MPLDVGSTQKVIGGNIAELIRSGRSPAQAAAISYKKAGKYRKPKRPRLAAYVGT